jgi:hypothetical protein
MHFNGDHPRVTLQWQGGISGLPSILVHEAIQRREASTHNELHVTTLPFRQIHGKSVASLDKLLALFRTDHPIHKLSPMRHSFHSTLKHEL